MEGEERTTIRQEGVYGGRSIARRFRSSEGWTILVGRNDRDNDLLTFKIGRPNDLWLHVAGESGSHVLVLNDGSDRVPRETEHLAAGLAARYSKARRGGRVAVHLCRCGEVTKPRGLPPGKVAVRRGKTVHAKPLTDEELEDWRDL